jgi:DNA (cytosine-5)-methyltransferase 1
MSHDSTSPPLSFGLHRVVDSFAAGGGASTGLERAFGRPSRPRATTTRVARDDTTIHLHTAHHTKAKGGKPLEMKIFGLAWTALR